MDIWFCCICFTTNWVLFRYCRECNHEKCSHCFVTPVICHKDDSQGDPSWSFKIFSPSTADSTLLSNNHLTTSPIMYIWKCCKCGLTNNFEKYHCGLCRHIECEFCLPLAAPAAIPLPQKPKHSNNQITILKRPNPDDPSTAFPSAPAEHLAQHSAKDPAAESAAIKAATKQIIYW